ncbi:MAG: hypothetical protein ACXVC6_06425 [Bacteroidia bacterium]
MKKAVLYAITLLTCLYFFSAGNITFFSKITKNYSTEFVDLDKDASDKSDESEKSDSKEDFNTEENFITENHLRIMVNSLLSPAVFYTGKSFFPPNPLLEVISPPPQA